MVFYIKIKDFRYSSHIMDITATTASVSTVSRKIVFIALTIAALKHLEVKATNI